MSPPAPDAATQKEVQRLLNRLIQLKKNWPQEPALRDLSPQTVQALQEYVDTQNSARLMAFIIIIAMMLTLYLLQSALNTPPVWLDAPLMIACVLATGYRPGKAHRYAVYALTQTHDASVLPTLIKATSQAWGMHPEVIRAITRLLPQVTEDDAGLLNRKAQERLWHLALASLNYKRECDEALDYGALHAFTCIGSRDTLNRMRDFTLPRWFAPSHRRVYDAIQQAIPLMEARLKRQEVPETLLRAAAMPAAPSDTLLRPARAVTPEPPEQLLRAGNDTQEE